MRGERGSLLLLEELLLLRLHLVIYRLSSALCRPCFVGRRGRQVVSTTGEAGRIDDDGSHEQEVTYAGVNHASKGCDVRVHRLAPEERGGVGRV